MESICRGRVLRNIVYILLSLVASVILFRGSLKLTYIEMTDLSTPINTNVQVDKQNGKLIQEFQMPYELLNSVTVQMKESENRNILKWIISIVEKNNGKQIYLKEFNTKCFKNNGYYRIVFDRNIMVKKGEIYLFQLHPVKVDEISNMVFLKQGEIGNTYSESIYNSKEINRSLRIKIYGGDRDFWWISFSSILVFFLFFLARRLFRNISVVERIKYDTTVQACLLGLVVFLLRFCLLHVGEFCDESDNMYGGMIIANGGVLYRDYVTQHMPIAYYICGVFALLGAGSIEQFRLSYYLVEAGLWMCLWIRHFDFYGKWRIAILAVFEILIIPTVVKNFGVQILSDSLQGIGFVILLLEFLKYLDDKKLDWGRSIIVSLAIYLCIGSAFVSLYSLVWMFIFFVLNEYLECRGKRFALRLFWWRYFRLILSLLLPFVLCVLYFEFNHSLEIAFRQFYLFNREVYSKYIGGFGLNIFQPFLESIKNLCVFVPSHLHEVLKMRTGTLMRYIVLFGALFGLWNSLKEKKHLQAMLVFLVMLFAGSRGYGFHGIAMWYVAIFAIVILGDFKSLAVSRVSCCICAIVFCFALKPFVSSFRYSYEYIAKPVSDLESRVISKTKPGEGIYLDVWASGSLYYFYKNRYPINRAVFMLPWYMDWYEEYDIEDLKIKRPRIAVYNENAVTWGIKNYNVNFVKCLKKHYKNDGQHKFLWIRKD